MVAPMALHRLGHPDGEVAVARAAAARGIVMSLSTVGSATIEEVASTGARSWFQLYLMRDRGRSQELLDRAAAAGYEAIILTIDCPILGRRERDIRASFRLPDGVGYANIRRGGLQRGDAYGEDELLASYSWDDLAWTVAHTPLPVVAKGVLRSTDAIACLDHGAAAVVVSNHGGRQLDTTIAALDALPAVVDTVADRAAVLFDSGIRRGTDVVVALALGARAVMLGRPLLFALPLGGEDAVRRALDLLLAEIDRALALVGVPCARDLRRDLLVRAGTLVEVGR
jgi:4-hydroxymandelate oxidase